MDIVIRNASQIVNYRDNKILRGDELKDLPVLKNKDIIVRDGVIDFIGDSGGYQGDRIIDAKNKVVMPGFIDAHTHVVFAGKRYDEFLMRAAGISYMEIAQKGGGILNTVKTTRSIPFDDLKKETLLRIEKMIKAGTTTIEAKSGYGLDLETEIKMINVLKELKKEGYNIEITFLGAHEVPPEYKNKKEEYIRLLIEQMIPRIANIGEVKYIDVFCEDKVFNKEESEYILKAGKDYGFLPRIHAEEIGYTGGARMAAELGAISADHLLLIKEEDLEVLKDNNTFAVVLPGTSFILRKNYAPVKVMRKSGVPIALASDFNPGSCPIYRMDVIIGISVLYADFTIEEAINAATVNAAAMLGLQDRGVIKEGYKGDLVIWNMEDYREMPYWFAGNEIYAVLYGNNIYYHYEDMNN